MINDLVLLLFQKNLESVNKIHKHIKKTKAKKKTLFNFVLKIEEFKERSGLEFISTKDETVLFSIENLK